MKSNQIEEGERLKFWCGFDLFAYASSRCSLVHSDRMRFLPVAPHT